jgi:hypothetical protein
MLDAIQISLKPRRAWEHFGKTFSRWYVVKGFLQLRATHRRPVELGRGAGRPRETRGRGALPTLNRGGKSLVGRWASGPKWNGPEKRALPVPFVPLSNRRAAQGGDAGPLAFGV